MNSAAFDTYTKHLQSALESAQEVIGLVTLGTTADSTFRDEWSDHDFWVITTAGAQDSLLKDLSWLPDAHHIALTVCHGKSYRTVVYRDQHKVEFAVLDVDEAQQGKAERYQILIDRNQIAGLMESVHQATIKQAHENQTRPYALENLCVLVWSAYERCARGELLSARQYLDGFAVNQLLSLISASDTDNVEAGNDELDPRRRLELRSPILAEEVLTILSETVPTAALHLLEIAERELKTKAPALAWDKVTIVQSWLRDVKE